MKKRITIITAGLFLGLLSMNAQTICSDDRIAYVDSKNVGPTGAYTLSVGAEEKASQTYYYNGPGKVGGARVFGSVPIGLGVKLRVSLYNVDANGRPTGSALANAPLKNLFSWSAPSFDVSFSPAVSVSGNFAMVVEILNIPGWGHNFDLKYTGNGEGNAEDLASLAGTSTGFNWASAMTAFSKDGDFYIYPRMTNYNNPMFSIANVCVNTGASVAFTNTTQMTTDPMFNKITAPGYAGTNHLYSWDFGDGSAVSHAESPAHTYAAAGEYTVSLTSTIEGWDGVCSRTYTKHISVGFAVSATAVTNVSCNGGNNGSIIAAGNGGATPYLFSLNGDIYQSGTSFNNLTAGIYTLYAKDNLGCIQTTTFTITQPGAIHFTSATSTNSSCGNADGGIVVASSGGVPPMQYRLNSGTFQTSGTFAGLNAGAYMVTAKDANGCMYSIMVVVNDAGGPAFNVTNFTNVSCFAGNDGSITLSSLGGTGNIQYSINGGTTYQASGSFANLTAGNYTAVVKDAAGCTDIAVIHISQPQHLNLSATGYDVSCFGGNNGQINVTLTTGGTGAVTYSLDGINFQSIPNFQGLNADTYTVYVRDVAGCMSNVLVTINEPSALTATVTATNATCNGYQDGTITITGTGGTVGYVYGIGGDMEYQSSGLFADLAAGTYALTVKDTKGCMFVTSGTINQPTLIVPVTTTTNSTCGNSNGGVLAVATGGSGAGYTFSLDGGTFGAGNFSGLAAGTYVITAKDATGCSATANASIFDSNGPSILSSTHTNVNCHGGFDGSITVGTVNGGTGALSYSIDGITYQPSTVFHNLPAGVYNVTVKDAVGCIGNTTETITEPNAIVITTNVVDVTCHGAYSGSVTMLVGGGSGTLAYSINNGLTYQSSNTFANLGAGDYDLIVKDAGGCASSTMITINQPAEILAYYASLDVSCFGSNNGAIIIHASGGTGAFQYSINGTVYQSSNIFSSLSGGGYTVRIKDANGCVKTMLASVYEPNPLVIASNVSDVTCSGGNNGVIDISVTGGSHHYVFNWSNGEITEDNFNLPAGTYSVVVHDDFGCTTNSTFVITQPANPIIVNGTVINSTGTNNGGIDITITGGSAGYTYQWSNGALTEDVANLLPGVYTVIVTDASGCAASSTFVVANTTGVESYESLENSISVYPNPANDYLFISIEGFRIEKVEVYDVLGQIAFTGGFDNSKVEINTSAISQGLYFVKILVDDKLITKKVKIIK